MTLGELLLRYDGAAMLLDDYDIFYDSDDDYETSLEDLCEDSGVDYWEMEEDLFMLEERPRGWDIAL